MAERWEAFAEAVRSAANIRVSSWHDHQQHVTRYSVFDHTGVAVHHKGGDTLVVTDELVRKTPDAQHTVDRWVSEASWVAFQPVAESMTDYLWFDL